MMLAFCPAHHFQHLPPVRARQRGGGWRVLSEFSLPRQHAALRLHHLLHVAQHKNNFIGVPRGQRKQKRRDDLHRFPLCLFQPRPIPAQPLDGLMLKIAARIAFVRLPGIIGKQRHAGVGEHLHHHGCAGARQAGHNHNRRRRRAFSMFGLRGRNICLLDRLVNLALVAQRRHGMAFLEIGAMRGGAFRLPQFLLIQPNQRIPRLPKFRRQFQADFKRFRRMNRVAAACQRFPQRLMRLRKMIPQANCRQSFFYRQFIGVLPQIRDAEAVMRLRIILVNR